MSITSEYQIIDNIAKKISKISFRKIYADMEAKKDKRELFDTLFHREEFGIRKMAQHLTFEGEQYLISRIQEKIPHKIILVSGSFHYYQILTSTGKWRKDRDTMKIYIHIETKKARYDYEYRYKDPKHVIRVDFDRKPTKKELNAKLAADIWQEVDELFC